MFDYGVNSEYIHLIQLAQMLQQSIVLVQSWDKQQNLISQSSGGWDV